MYRLLSEKSAPYPVAVGRARAAVNATAARIMITLSSASLVKSGLLAARTASAFLSAPNEQTLDLIIGGGGHRCFLLLPLLPPLIAELDKLLRVSTTLSTCGVPPPPPLRPTSVRTS